MTQSPIPDDPHANTENSSPSDFHSSVETSPAIVPLSEPTTSDGGHSPPSTSTRPPYRNSLDIQRSVSTAGRGGCWYVHVLKLYHLRRVRCPVLMLLLPPLGPAVFDEKYVPPLARRPAPMVDANSPARFSRSCLRCALCHRNAMNNVKRATPVALAAVCNSIASDGAHDDLTGCGCVIVLPVPLCCRPGMLTHARR
jgi:hypothetical protein